MQPAPLHVVLVALEAHDRQAAALVAAQPQIGAAGALGALPVDASASDSRVSCSSERRATSGDASACSITRSASQPSSNERNDQPS